MIDKSCKTTECKTCNEADCIWRPRTNADRLNAMTVEEKAKWIAHIAGCPLNVFEESPLGRCTTNCKAQDCWLGWLKQEAEQWRLKETIEILQSW